MALPRAWARVLSPPILLMAFAPAAIAQEARPNSDPPEVLPNGARFGSAPVQLGQTPVQLGTSSVVVSSAAGPGQSATRQESAGAARADPLSGSQPAALVDPPREFEPADPLTSVPTGARFGSVALTFREGSLSFGSSATALGGAPTALATGAAGLAVREEPGGVLRFTLAADVLFDFDKSALRRDAAPVLAKLMDEVRARVPAGGRFTVEGHTDWIGSDAYNDRLSNKRAASVKTWLTKAGGVSGFQVVTIGYGERRPVAPNAKPDGSDDPDGRQKNRRVDILVRTR